MDQIFPAVKFVANTYSQKWADALGKVYSDDIKKRESEAAVLYQEWWDKRKAVFFNELKERMGISMSGGVIPVYIVTFLPNRIPFSPPTTLNYLFNDDTKQVEIKAWTALHEVIHYFEDFDEEVLARINILQQSLLTKYPQLDLKTRNHIVTSLIKSQLCRRLTLERNCA